MSQLEVQQAREKDAVVKDNPFAAFLAARRPAPRSKASEPEWPSQERQDADPVLLAVGKASREALTRPLESGRGLGLPASPAGDHFSTFLSLGAARKPLTRCSEKEQMLREEVLRAKKQLLEVTLQTEQRALDPYSKEEDLEKQLERLRAANDYLRNPERAFDLGGKKQMGIETSAMMADTMAPLSPIHPTGNWGQGTAWSPMSISSSVPNLRAGASSSFLPAINGDSSRPGAFPGSPARSSGKDQEPLLSGWWSQTRCWNVGISKQDRKARRLTLDLPGGTVVLGNGRMPNFSDDRLLARGYYYAFQIDEVDSERSHLSVVFGVSQLPARNRSCERPMYAYEVPGAALLGYGGNLIDKGRWLKTTWDPKNLKCDDVVGLLVTEEGDLVVFVNEEQVLRVKTSLNDNLEGQTPTSPASPVSDTMSLSRKGSNTRAVSKGGAQGIKRLLFPILDLHGHVSAVTILPRKSPPNVPLKCRNKLPA
jgi:hypothetical protein